MLKLLLAVPSLLVFAFLPQEPAAPAKPMPADAATLTNPVKPTPASQAHAKQVYGYDCAMCHGENGNGKGDVATDMNLALKDLGDPATLKGVSDGELFYIIKDGKGKMPGEGDRIKPDVIWNLVVYVRSLARK